ncbi:MAG: hypothetical protein M3442_16760 [Chloroflexota bacterium]|nr:hypothetical protein [Chloroflexota bacterium]
MPLLLVLLLPAPPAGVAPPYARAAAGAPRLAGGVHAPNRTWEEGDYQRMAGGQLTGVKMMSYHPPGAYARLRRDNPAIDFAVRLDTPWNELPLPADFAAYHVPTLRALVGAGFSPWVEIGNEPNLELHPGAEAAFARWYVETLYALREAVPELRYGFPGLAVDQREADWLEANALAIEMSDWLGVHAYWKDEREMLDPQRALKLIAVHRRFPQLPMLVTEAGNNAAGVPLAERARQYARFTRIVSRLPYVRALHYFILSGTVDWQMFFFDDLAVAAVGNAPRDSVPLLSGLQDARRHLGAVGRSFLGRPRQGGPDLGAVPPQSAVAPPLVPAAPRRLIADPAPAPLVPGSPAVPHSTAGRWIVPPTDGASGASEVLRSASAYLATDLSLRADVPPPRPGVPVALQIAEADLFAPAGEGGTVAGEKAGEPTATGFALLWDGIRWHLQYRRAGEILADAELEGVPDAPPAGGLYRVEMALAPRSAAAWIWRPDEARPAQPQAVFAPPATSASDGSRPRFVYLPAQPVADLIMEGLTRFS